MDAQPIRSLPIACTLDGAGQAERLDQWRRLLARADRRERVEGGLRFQLPATLAGPAAELAAAEQRCCAFFAFTLRLAGGGLELEVRAPTEALPLLTEVFGPARLFWRPRRVATGATLTGPRAGHRGRDDAVAAVRDVRAGRAPGAGLALLISRLGELLARDYDWSAGLTAITAPVVLVFADADSIFPA